MTATHCGSLNIPTLPSQARHVDIFPDWIGSLLSIGMLCDCGLTATYTATTVTIPDSKGSAGLSGYRTHPSKLWFIDINQSLATHALASSNAPTMFCNAVVTEARGTQAQIVEFYHASMGSPAVSTLTYAINHGWVILPGLTSAMIARFPPVTTATPKGHMDQFMKGKRSTKTIVPSSTGDADLETSDDLYPATESRPPHALKCVIKVIPSSDIRHTDLTGRFPVAGKSGKQYFMIMICANYIHVELMSTRCAGDYVKAYAQGTDFFQKYGITPSYETIDNETSDELERYCLNHVPRITIKYVPPKVHRGNKAERAIRTFKNHFIAMLCTTDHSPGTRRPTAETEATTLETGPRGLPTCRLSKSSSM